MAEDVTSQEVGPGVVDGDGQEWASSWAKSSRGGNMKVIFNGQNGPKNMKEMIRA